MQKATLAITGAAGYLGRALLNRAMFASDFGKIIGIDIRPAGVEGAVVHLMDVQDPRLADLFLQEGVTHVAHLAFAVNPTHHPDLEYNVDVGGTRNLLAACVAGGIRKLVVSSSIAAYGWHEDNPIPIAESHRLRGNEDFPYARNKVEVERLIQDFTRANPASQVTVLRICNVLGPNVHNAISAGIEAPVLFGVTGCDPFLAFTHEEDMTEILYRSLIASAHGVFNVAGGGMLRLSEMADMTGRTLLRLPAWLLRLVLHALFKMRLLPFGGGQMGFVRYSCVPDTSKLEREFGYKPRYSSEETFREFVRFRMNK